MRKATSVESLHSRVGGNYHGITAACETAQGLGDRFQGERPGSARPVGRSRMNEVISAPEAVARLASIGKEPVLRVVNGSKIYGGVHAIENIDFDLYAGEVHALVGENGAGKSTLCKAIAGAIKLTSGEYYVDGKPVNFERPRDALAAGICMVYQETSLVPTMTAAQNIELGNEKLITSFKKLNIQAQQLLQSLNFHIDPATPIGVARHRQAADGRDRPRSLQRRPYHHLR